MSKGKWDVRNRLSADRHKLSLLFIFITVTDCYLVHHYLPVRIREGLDVEVRGRPGEEKLGQPAAVPPSGPWKY